MTVGAAYPLFDAGSIACGCGCIGELSDFFNGGTHSKPAFACSAKTTPVLNTNIRAKNRIAYILHFQLLEYLKTIDF